jgi:hypothetical protein
MRISAKKPCADTPRYAKLGWLPTARKELAMAEPHDPNRTVDDVSAQNS